MTSWRPTGGGAEAGFASRELAPGSSTDPSTALGVPGRGGGSDMPSTFLAGSGA